jgi:hypothetical protein
MGLISRLFGTGDPWERVPAHYATALRARLTEASFVRLGKLLRTYKQFTDEHFPAEVATRTAEGIREHVAARLLHLAFRFSDTLKKVNSTPALRMSDATNPAHLAVRECLQLSIEIRSNGNPATLLLPEYLLDAGQADDAVAAASRALPDWERRLSGAMPKPSSNPTRPLEAVLVEFLAQAGGNVDIIGGLRSIALREITIRRHRESLTDAEYATLRAMLANWLAQRDIAVDPNSDTIERYPLRPTEVSLLSAWIVENTGTLRGSFSALELLRVAHVLQPEFTNVNEVLADIYFRSQEGAAEDNDSAVFRERARQHATLAIAGMTEALGSPDALEGTGLTDAAMRGRLSRMQEIQRALA